MLTSVFSACGSVTTLTPDAGSAGTGASGSAGAAAGIGGGGASGTAGASGQGGHGGAGAGGQGGAGGHGGAAGGGGAPAPGFCNTDNDCVYRPAPCCGGTCAAMTDPLPSPGPAPVCNIACVLPQASCACTNHYCSTAPTCAPADGGCNSHDAATDGPTCPATVPVAGDPCTPILSCEYGGDVHHACVTRANCVSAGVGTTFHWELTPPPATCGAHPAPCPAAFASLADGSACPGNSSLTCDYAIGRCGCLSCSKGTMTGSVWACRRWDSGGTGCPAVAPLVGDACATPNLTCIYGGCGISVGDNFRCSGGTWQIAAIGFDCAARICPAGI
jgi:hypothetical protein